MIVFCLRLVVCRALAGDEREEVDWGREFGEGGGLSKCCLPSTLPIVLTVAIFAMVVWLIAAG